MNLKKLSGLEASPGATDAEIASLEAQIGSRIPVQYKRLLQLSNGFFLDNGLHIYSSSYVFERNQTFEVSKYAPGYLSIGDDSGGQSLLMPLDGSSLFKVDNGSMRPEDFQPVAADLTEWVNTGCSLEN